MYRRSTSGQC